MERSDFGILRRFQQTPDPAFELTRSVGDMKSSRRRDLGTRSSFFFSRWSNVDFKDLETYMFKLGDAAPNTSGRQGFLENPSNELF